MIPLSTPTSHEQPGLPSGEGSPTPLFAKPLFWAVLVCVGAVGFVLLQDSRGPAGPADGWGGPPVLTAMPGFRLTDQDGRAFGSDELTGQVWVANFIFTRCPTICPELTAKMKLLEERTHDQEGVHLVSFSVDPDHDTPEVLSDYRAKHGSDCPQWSFLTGTVEQVKVAIEDGLRVEMGNDGVVLDVNSVLHGPHFVLVDDQSRIRGYYDVSAEDGMDRLQEDVGRLTEARRRRESQPVGG